MFVERPGFPRQPTALPSTPATTFIPELSFALLLTYSSLKLVRTETNISSHSRTGTDNDLKKECSRKCNGKYTKWKWEVLERVKEVTSEDQIARGGFGERVPEFIVKSLQTSHPSLFPGTWQPVSNIWRAETLILVKRNIPTCVHGTNLATLLTWDLDASLVSNKLLFWIC